MEPGLEAAVPGLPQRLLPGSSHPLRDGAAAAGGTGRRRRAGYAGRAPCPAGGAEVRGQAGRPDRAARPGRRRHGGAAGGAGAGGGGCGRAAPGGDPGAERWSSTAPRPGSTSTGCWSRSASPRRWPARCGATPTGAEVMDHLLRGSGDELGFGAITEIRMVRELRYVGPLPAELQILHDLCGGAAAGRAGGGRGAAALAVRQRGAGDLRRGGDRAAALSGMGQGPRPLPCCRSETGLATRTSCSGRPRSPPTRPRSRSRCPSCRRRALPAAPGRGG